MALVAGSLACGSGDEAEPLPEPEPLMEAPSEPMPVPGFDEVQVSGEPRRVEAGSCAEVAFEACGGDPRGTWEFVATCAVQTESTLADSCVESVETAAEVDGVVVISEAELRQTATVFGTETRQRPASCERSVPCEAPADRARATSAVERTGDSCVIVTDSVTDASFAWPIAVGPSSLFDAAAGGVLFEYCQAGDGLSLAQVLPSGLIQTTELRRQ